MNKKISVAPRPPGGDDINGAPSVVRVSIGGPDEWRRLWYSVSAQLADLGVDLGPPTGSATCWNMRTRAGALGKPF